MTDHVILVDTNDREIGTMAKMEAHIEGLLHRAFSVFIFNTKGELLLQRRAFEKYHSGGKWTNTCCSHPRPGEALMDAAQRRLREEMGMQAVLQHAFSFTYQADLLDGLTENEYDHVFFGVTDQVPAVNPEEVSAYRYVDMQHLSADIDENPDDYTAWLKICFNRVAAQYPQLFL